MRPQFVVIAGVGHKGPAQVNRGADAARWAPTVRDSGFTGEQYRSLGSPQRNEWPWTVSSTRSRTDTLIEHPQEAHRDRQQF
jgi:hypothetical protein